MTGQGYTTTCPECGNVMVERGMAPDISLFGEDGVRTVMLQCEADYTHFALFHTTTIQHGEQESYNFFRKLWPSTHS